LKRTILTAALAVSMMATAAVAQMKVQPKAPPGKASSMDVTVGGKQGATVTTSKKISIGEANKLVKEGKAVLVDVRSPEQFALGHIKGALSIPGSQLVTRLRDIPPGKMIITYCACSAEQSSGRAVMDLNARGVKNAAALTGGWLAWQKAGLPTATGRS
jgi:rhodanese-related sulfurtransferase